MPPTPPRRTPPRRIRVGLILLATGLVGWLAVSFVALMYATRRAERPFEEPALAIQNEAVEIEAEDGVRIRAWFTGGPAAHTCLLVLHGNGGSRGGNRQLLESLASEDRAILAITHRGHGDSGGHRNDLGSSARYDVVAGVTFLEERVDDCDVFIVGRSLGSAAALLAAPLTVGRVTGYFLESPYTALDEAIRRRADDLMPRHASAALLAGMRPWSPLLVNGGFDSAQPIDAISVIDPSVEIVLITGSEDRLVTTEDVARFVARRPTATRTVLVDGAGHSPPLFSVARDQYLAALESLIQGTASIGTH